MLLHLIEYHQTRAVVKPAHRIGSQPETLVRIIKRNVDRRILLNSREEIPHESGLARLTRSRHNGNRGTLQTATQERKYSSGVQ